MKVNFNKDSTSNRCNDIMRNLLYYFIESESNEFKQRITIKLEVYTKTGYNRYEISFRE